MDLGNPNLDVFAAILQELAQTDPHLLVVTSDSRGSGKLGPFAAAFPDRVVEVGIAEQNLVGIAAGLAAAGKTVFAVSPASFLTTRGLEQIKNDIAYSDQPVKVIGISAGVSYGALGSTHHSLHDFAVLRAIHNLAVIAPADNAETRAAIRAAVVARHPVYIRFGKQAMPHVHTAPIDFVIGKAIPIASGRDVTFVAAGEAVAPAVGAREVLAAAGIEAGVLSMHTVKPLDTAALLAAARQSRAVITVEEHSIFGGLGEACAAVLAQNGVSVPFKIVGFPDEDTVTGAQGQIFAHYGISPEGLAQTARALLRPERIP